MTTEAADGEALPGRLTPGHSGGLGSGERRPPRPAGRGALAAGQHARNEIADAAMVIALEILCGPLARRRFSGIVAAGAVFMHVDAHAVRVPLDVDVVRAALGALGLAGIFPRGRAARLASAFHGLAVGRVGVVSAANHGHGFILLCDSCHSEWRPDDFGRGAAKNPSSRKSEGRTRGILRSAQDDNQLRSILRADAKRRGSEWQAGNAKAVA